MTKGFHKENPESLNFSLLPFATGPNFEAFSRTWCHTCKVPDPYSRICRAWFYLFWFFVLNAAVAVADGRGRSGWSWLYLYTSVVRILLKLVFLFGLSRIAFEAAASAASPLAVWFSPITAATDGSLLKLKMSMSMPHTYHPRLRISGAQGTLRSVRRRWNKSLLFLLKWIDTDLHLGDKKASFYLRP